MLSVAQIEFLESRIQRVIRRMDNQMDSLARSARPFGFVVLNFASV